jgi:hypothetical protein
VRACFERLHQVIFVAKRKRVPDLLLSNASSSKRKTERIVEAKLSLSAYVNSLVNGF